MTSPLHGEPTGMPPPAHKEPGRLARFFGRGRGNPSQPSVPETPFTPPTTLAEAAAGGPPPPPREPERPQQPEPEQVKKEFPKFSHFEIPTAEATGDPDVDRLVVHVREYTTSQNPNQFHRDRENNIYRRDSFNALQTLNNKIAETTDEAERARLIKARQEISARHVYTSTVMDADDLFGKIHEGKFFVSEHTMIPIPVDRPDGVSTLYVTGLPGIRTVTDAITFLQDYATNPRYGYEDVKTRMGHGEKYDQSLGLFIAELGNRLKETPPAGYSSEKVVQAEEAVREGQIKYRHPLIQETTRAMRERIKDLETVQTTSEALAQDPEVAGELAELKAAQERIIPEYVQLTTRGNAEDAVKQLKSSHRLNGGALLIWSDNNERTPTEMLPLRAGISTPRDLLEAVGEYMTGEDYQRGKEFMGDRFSQFDSMVREYRDQVARDIMKEPHIRPEQVAVTLGVLQNMMNGEGGHIPSLHKGEIDSRIYNLETILRVRGNLPASFQQELDTLRSQRTELVDLYCTVQTQKSAEEDFNRMKTSYGLGQATIHYPLGDSYSAQTINIGVYQHPSQIVNHLRSYKEHELPKIREQMDPEVARNFEKGIDTYMATLIRLQGTPSY